MKTALRIVGIVMGTLAAVVADRPALAQLPCQYELVATIQGPDCGITGITGLTPTAISPNGLYVTGWYAQCDVGDEAFLWIGPPPGTLFTIPRPPGTEHAQGYDVNDNAVVTGLCYQSDKMRGFVYKYQAAQWITLSPPQSGGQLQPSAINNANTVVGYRSIRNDNVPREAFIWNESTGFQGLGVMNGPSSGAKDISESGIVVGWTGTNASPFYNNVRAFMYQAGKPVVLGPIPGGITSMAFCVNASGEVVVAGKISSTVYKTFLYDAGELTPLAVPTGCDGAFVYGMSDSGMLVGDCDLIGSQDSPACIWSGGASSGGASLVLQGNITPDMVDFSHTNYAAGASMSGAVLLVGRTYQNLSVGFVLLPLPSDPGDTNCDKFVNIDDLLNVIVSWGPCAECPTDLDSNGQVNIDDLLTVIAHWSP